MSNVNLDFYDWDKTLSEEDIDLVNRIRSFVQEDVLPIINESWEKADFPYDELIPGFQKLGIMGTSVKGYGSAGLTRLQTGLVARELARGDGSVNTANAVLSGLVVGTLDLLGSETQKEKWIPSITSLEKLGAFALTEPDHGSDSVALETQAELDGDFYVLNGSKRWIGLGHVADIVIVWARDTADNKVKAFIVEKDADGNYPAGYEASAIPGKIAKRAIQQADIRINNVRIPKENLLYKSRGFRDVNAVLNKTRSTVAWEALGHAEACFEIAVEYVSNRKQFGEPLAHRQLVQNALANMYADLTAMQSLLFRSAELQDANDFSNEQASVAKMFCCDKGREICRKARDLMGGNGLLLENHVARHLTDMEVLHTYEGTDFIQSLLIGREITSISAFA